MDSDRGIVTAMVISCALVIGARWTRNQQLDARIAVGGLFATLALTTLHTYSPQLGKGLTAVVLVTSIIVNGPVVFAGIDKITGGTPTGGIRRNPSRLEWNE